MIDLNLNGSRFLRAVIVVLCLAASGCGKGDLSGTVSFKGKPVVLGQVMVIDSSGASLYSNIGPDGSYQVAGVATGQAKVVVSSPNPKPKDGPGLGARSGGRGSKSGQVSPDVEGVDPELAKKWVELPAEVGDPTKTKLTVTVKRGANAHNIEIPEPAPSAEPPKK